jgi:acyl carrier protein
MAISRSSIAATLEEFIREIAQIPDDDSEFTRTVHLFDAGYVDSLGIVSLMEFIESSFGVGLIEEDLFDERFVTMDGMSEIIADLLSRRAARRASPL